MKHYCIYVIAVSSLPALSFDTIEFVVIVKGIVDVAVVDDDVDGNVEFLLLLLFDEILLLLL